MSRSKSCNNSRTDSRKLKGITYGTKWYPVTKKMEDSDWFDCMEVTLELSFCKYSSGTCFRMPNQLLLNFLSKAQRVIEGFILDKNGNILGKSYLKIKSKQVAFQNRIYVGAWRMLIPGIYKMKVYPGGYIPREIEFRMVKRHPASVNVTLHIVKEDFVPLVIIAPKTISKDDADVQKSSRYSNN